jgi:hypothetical protein
VTADPSLLTVSCQESGRRPDSATDTKRTAVAAVTAPAVERTDQILVSSDRNAPLNPALAGPAVSAGNSVLGRLAWAPAGLIEE